MNMKIPKGWKELDDGEMVKAGFYIDTLSTRVHSIDIMNNDKT
jgi:hypothetical protein